MPFRKLAARQNLNGKRSANKKPVIAHRLAVPICQAVVPKQTELGRESHCVQTSDDANVFCSRSLGPLAFRVLDALTLLEIIELDAFDIRHVEEHVFA